ncbi:MAG TPA: hypothetical protein VEU33_25625, partial [Archangium sp.]|nr:hypothetical protein [Archangium sp.]
MAVKKAKSSKKAARPKAATKPSVPAQKADSLKPLPEVSNESRLQQDSKIEFRKAVRPWLVSDNSENDFGHDSSVEIVRQK